MANAELFSATNIKKDAIVPLSSHGKRADVVLAELFPDYSRSQLSQWLKDGLITFNNLIYKPKEKVMGNEHVLLHITLENKGSDEAEDIPLVIVFEDEHLLVVNKPAGLVVHPGAGNPKHTLVNALLNHAPELQQLPRAGIIHRLDKGTTGLLIVAKTLSAYTLLVRQMQDREIQRRYQALVYGHVIAGSRLETCYGRHPKNRLKMTVTQQGKEAITEFSVKKQYGQFTLLDVKLHTGRTHQIRVHMAYLNHPIVGDQLYGGRARFPAGASDKLKTAIREFERQALHAYHLSFLHPMSKEELTFTIPLPDDFATLLSYLDADNE